MSAVWMYFSLENENSPLAICNVCKMTVPRGGICRASFNTTNLIRHLKMRHETEYGVFCKATDQKAALSKRNSLCWITKKKRQTAPKRQADPPHKKSRQSLGRKIQTLLGSSCSDDEEPSHLFAPIGDSDIESSDMDSMDHVSWRCLTSGSMKMITNVIKPFVSSLSCTFSSVFQVRSLLSYQIVKACTLTLAKLWMTVAVSYTGMWFQVLRSAHIAIYMRNYSN
ncbi:uncharacterized protein LOC133538062 isoform X2 [Nerophis ophidion]|uniref:uncharacterized protein LOC133538062 isoform X2 n=1 Tax=Nerophis ophidion TaxID=159077 RepID=UPI002ADF83BC|nr:uncharacterized protein LOC133538062 isoform X2 [Nerophis ophidion]